MAYQPNWRRTLFVHVFSIRLADGIMESRGG